MEKDILERVRRYIVKHRMLSGGEKVIVGLSGGPDSVFLLHVLNELSREFKLSLIAMYVDHGLRPEEVPAELEFCKKLSEDISVPFYSERVDVKGLAEREGLSIQEAGRLLRYDAFERRALIEKADRIATGHHMNDQAETLLINLIRGTGRRGLSGIPPVRGKFIRPLLCLKKDDILGYLNAKKITFIEDTSNKTDKYLRNKIRKRLLPLLEEFNPSIVETLSGTSDTLRLEEEYLNIKTTKFLMRIISRKADDELELFLSPLENIEDVILKRALRWVIGETRGLRGIGRVHIDDIVDLIRKGDSGDRIYLPDNYRVIKGYSTLVITARKPLRLGQYSLEPPGEVVLKEAGLVLKAEFVDGREGEISPDGKLVAVFDPESLTFPLRIRPRMDGDSFHPFGMRGEKKLQDFFVDEKIPRDERDRVPLVVSGDEIIWVVGYRTDERYRVGDFKKKLLKLTVSKLRNNPS